MAPLSKRLRWAGHVARLEESKGAFKILTGKATGFLRPEKNPSTSAGFEPVSLGFRSEHVTPRPPRPYKQRKYHEDK